MTGKPNRRRIGIDRISATRLLYPNVVPRSVTNNFLAPVFFAFSTTCPISAGAKYSQCDQYVQRRGSDPFAGRETQEFVKYRQPWPRLRTGPRYEYRSRPRRGIFHGHGRALRVLVQRLARERRQPKCGWPCRNWL